MLLSSKRIDWTVEDILAGTATRWRSRQSRDSSSSSISSKIHSYSPHSYHTGISQYLREKLQLHWSGQIGSSLHVCRVDWNDWPWLQYKSFGSTSLIFVSWIGIRLRLEEWRFWPPVHFMNGAREAFRFRKWAIFGQEITKILTKMLRNIWNCSKNNDWLWFDQFLDIWWGSHSKVDFHSTLKFRGWHFYQKAYLENAKIYFSPNWVLPDAVINVQKFWIEISFEDENCNF